MRRITVLFCLLVVTLLFTGCDKQIFKHEGEEFLLKPVKDSELEDNVYYVKKGSRFYKTHLPEGTASGITNIARDKRLLWVSEDYTLIPELFKDEIIAYQSTANTLSDITVERFKDLGYSVGIYGGTIDEDGMYCFTVTKHTVPGSDANLKLNDLRSDNIRIATIDDISITNYTLANGVITGLSQDKTYVFGLYVGTVYQTVEIKADRMFLQSYEVSKIKKAETTKNGYLSIQLPDLAKSGYYMINGAGIFAYYNFARGEKEIAEVDMNEAYFGSTADQMAANTQQYVASVKTATLNVLFKIEYDRQNIPLNDIYCVLTSPDGIEYEMDVTEDSASKEIALAIAGTWKINIYPKDLVISNIVAESTSIGKDAIMDQYDVAVGEGTQNYQFGVSYTGEGKVWGIVIGPDEQTTVMTVDSKNKTLIADYPYAKPGTYTIMIYHYVDTSIYEITAGTNEDKQTIEIITVED